MSTWGLATLQDRIAYCRETFVRYQARGEPVQVQTDGPMAPLIEQGRELYSTRFGQLDFSCLSLSCAAPGPDAARTEGEPGTGQRISRIPLGHGAHHQLDRRFREYFRSFRAEPFDPGSPEYKLLELYLMQRGNGLPIETPAVRF